MVRLSVNLNKVALIRNSRGSNYPDLIKVAQDCEEFGAQGITIHPRPDERHARFSDIPALKEVVKTELNIEGYPSEKFIDAVIENKPDQCTLVPDLPGALTSDNGWDTIKNKSLLSDICKQLSEHDIRSSLFVNADPTMVVGAKELGADRIEFYTGPYAFNFRTDKQEAIHPFIEAAREANRVGIEINAGHDLNLDNLHFFKESISNLKEVSIGHALICDAIYYGLENVIQMYLNELSR